MVSLGNGASHPELSNVSATVAQIRDELEGSINKSIAVMEAEHRVVEGLLARLRELTDGDRVPADT